MTSLLLVAERPTEAKTSAGVAGVASIVPGLGQVINGDTLEGAAWFSTTLGLVLSRNRILGQAGYDLWQYNMYDAFRDAKPANHDWKENNVFENYIAVFNPLNVVDPIGAPMLGIAALGNGHSDRVKTVPSNLAARAFLYGFVGLGEEGLFRGFLFPAFSDVFGSRLVGAFTSSVLFAYFHVTNGAADIAPRMLLMRTTLGLLFCWQTYNNKYDLRHSIFTHAWWDFLVTRSGGVQGLLGWKFNL